MKINNFSAMTDMVGHGALDLGSLDQGLIAAVARSAQQAELSKRSQVERLQQATQVTDPEKLHALQVEMAKFVVEIAAVNAIVRKGVSALETLVKS